MKCPKCNKQNRDKALYCKWCGESVVMKQDNPLVQLTGMNGVKEKLQELIRTCQGIATRARTTGVTVRLGMDMVITGNTGTGKSELVNAIQQLLYANNIVTKSKATIIDAVDYDNFSRKTDKEDCWRTNIEKAKGGLLVIENAHKLLPQQSSNDINKLDRLFTCMNGEIANDPIIILSGLSGLKLFMATNPDVANRFEYHFDLSDFSCDELKEICIKKLTSYKLTLIPEADKKLVEVIKYAIRNKKDDFGNGHFANIKAVEIFSNTIRRAADSLVAIPDDIPGECFHQKSYEEIMQEFDRFVGIDEIKETIKKIIHQLDIQSERNAGSKREVKDHFLFLGNPGTGKTTIARIFADIMNALEVLPTGQLIEVTRKDLVAGYIGQTALLVENAVQRAMGGILFIDEAYTLKQNENDSFGQEAIDTLLKLMEDNRGKFIVIAAGYSKEMADFINANSGMKSRFNRTINFKDYNAEELTDIFHRMVKGEHLSLDLDAETHIGQFFKKIYIARNQNSFGNAREVRNIFDDALKNQAIRLQVLREDGKLTNEMLSILTRADIEGEENLKEKDINTLLSELNEFVGMGSIKKSIRELATKLQMDRKMMELGYGDAELTNVHIVLTGNPGTGKTTIANKLGEILHAIGLLPSPKVVVKEPKDILSTIVNESAKNMDKACDEAMGATLLIDEAYNLAKVDDMGRVDPIGTQAVEALMTRMSRDAGKFVVIIAGYKDRIEQFIRKANPGLARRFTTNLHIEDYNGEELSQIFINNAHKGHLILTDDAILRLKKLANQMVDSKGENFGNAGEIIKVLSETKTRKANRLAALINSGEKITQENFATIIAEDIPYTESKTVNAEDCLIELNNLVGLYDVKREVKEIANYINVEHAKAKAFGKKFQGLRDHYLFVGNPGTGKTTVARIMANIFQSLGVLPTNKLIETTRDGLVGEYQGHTARKTEEIFKSAMGGVLFIDEAYSLKQSENDSFGQEAIDTLLKLMEDNRGRIICIAAGYPNEINKWLNSNSGLKSRFNKTIHFTDYNGDDLANIFIKIAEKDQLTLTPQAEEKMRGYFEQLYQKRGYNFANAREVNEYFACVKTNQSSRIMKRMTENGFQIEEFKTLVEEDMPLEKRTM